MFAYLDGALIGLLKPDTSDCEKCYSADLVEAARRRRELRDDDLQLTDFAFHLTLYFFYDQRINGRNEKWNSRH